MPNASLTEMVDLLAKRLKINYIIDPAVRGTVSIFTYGEVKPIDYMPLLETILRVNGDAAKEVSELTLVNVDTGDKVVLVLNQVINSPDVYCQFYYEWPQPAQKIVVKKLQEFVLRPEVDDLCIDFVLKPIKAGTDVARRSQLLRILHHQAVNGKLSLLRRLQESE